MMNRLLMTLGATFATAWAATATAASLTEAEIIQLQADMQAHIEATSIDGAVIGFDPEHAEVRTYYPTKAHPKIMSMGDQFVMCSDMVDTSGKPVMANFYMAKQGDHFIVFHTSFGEDPALTRMMADGRLAMAN